MAIFGWLVCVVLMLYLIVIAVLTAMNTLGKYNIGGVPNKFGDRLMTIIFVAIVGLGWMVIYVNAPFTIGLK